MVSDDKRDVYKSLNGKNESNGPKKASYSKPFSKFATIPSGDRINLYSAICTECHNEVKVNFEPVKNEPFFCDYCFNHHRIHPQGQKLL